MRMATITAVLLAAGLAQAVPLDPGSPDGVAAKYSSGDQLNVLCTNGEAWIWSSSTRQWEQPFDGALNPPVLLANIADWNLTSFHDTAGDYWFFNGADGWVVAPRTPPCGAVPGAQHSIGELKSLFR